MSKTTPEQQSDELTPQQWWEVTSPPEELAARCAKLMPHEDVLSTAELETLVRAIAADRSMWKPLIIEDRNRRRYRLLYEDHRIDVWVLSWMPGQATGFHDHDVSGVGLICAQGAVLERQMLLPEGATSIVMNEGVSRQGGAGYIHAVRHESGEPAISIHAYSPRLEHVGQYVVDDNGILRREINHGRQELLDYTIADRDPSRA